MRRTEFIKTCGFGCIGLMGIASFAGGCAGTKYLEGTLTDSFLEVPLSAFEIIKEQDRTHRRSVVVQHSRLQYPIVVFRHSGSDYAALLMKCTHQGTELNAFGDRLECPAHGSQFTSAGKVVNGPADADLRSLPVVVENDTLKIDLS